MKWVVLVALVAACKDKDPPQVVERTAPAPAAVAEPPAQCTPGERTCVRDTVVQCKANGTLGEPIERCPAACRNGACVDTCALRDVELVYVVDDRGRLQSFDPKKLPGDPFHLVGTLECPSTETPNSMAVDRNGIAWLNYHDGKLYRASIIDAHCAADAARPHGAPQDFGMGFVSTGPKATTETLWVAGRAPSAHLATIDLAETPARWTTVAKLSTPRHPELTGTGDGRLYGYFPDPGRGFVQQIDQTSGALVGTRWTLGDPTALVTAWAFAHWGGVFYVFSTADESSMIHAIHIKSGKQEIIKRDLPFRIVGAGVSTCAPLLERAPDP